MGRGRELALQALTPQDGHRSKASAGELRARSWQSLTAHQCFGRFVPDTENEAEADGLTPDGRVSVRPDKVTVLTY